MDHIFAGILDANVCLLNQAFEVRKQVLFLFVTPSEVCVPALWGPSFKLLVVILPTSSFCPPTLGVVTVPCSYISVSPQCCPSGISNSPLPGWLFFILNSLFTNTWGGFCFLNWILTKTYLRRLFSLLLHQEFNLHSHPCLCLGTTKSSPVFCASIPLPPGRPLAFQWWGISPCSELSDMFFVLRHQLIPTVSWWLVYRSHYTIFPGSSSLRFCVLLFFASSRV